MLIAIVHYHLNRGGVTQVIAGHLRALDRQAAAAGGTFRVLVLHGGRAAGWPDRPLGVNTLECQVRAVPGLDYDDAAPRAPRGLAARLRAGLAEAGGSPQSTVVHVHNHALGKNGSLPGALAELAGEGWPLLLQIHDFAEDFRPLNYQRLRAGASGQADGDWAAAAYPQAGHVHYAVLNQRDARILAASGVEPQRVHALPNPAGPLERLRVAESLLEASGHEVVEGAALDRAMEGIQGAIADVAAAIHHTYVGSLLDAPPDDDPGAPGGADRLAVSPDA